MEIDDDEEEAGPVGVGIAHQPARIDVAHRLFDGAERHQVIGTIMHRQDDAGDDLDHQGEAGQDAEVPEIIEVARNGIARTHSVIGKTRKRQLLVDPHHHRIFRRILLSPGKAHRFLPQPTRMAVSEVKLNFGTSRLVGAGPLRMRAAVS